jgi:hypothetical protein
VAFFDNKSWVAIEAKHWRGSKLEDEQLCAADCGRLMAIHRAGCADDVFRPWQALNLAIWHRKYVT